MFALNRKLSFIILVAAVSSSFFIWRRSVYTVSDFTSLWVAGNRLLAHQNPYDSAYALAPERSMGLTGQKPLVMRNPPWALWIVLPLGALPYALARGLWTLLLVAVLWISASVTWAMYRPAPARSWLPILMTFSFAPTLASVSAGQTAPFVFLGLSLFLYLYERHEFWAGVALLLAAFKPQVAFLFWLSFLLWCLQYRKWRLVLGLMFGIGMATAVALLLDARVFRDYRTMMMAESIDIQFIPTLGGLLRQTFAKAWLQIAPAIAGVAGTLVYYLASDVVWDWKYCLPPVLLGSLLLTPYAWLHDELIVLIALIGAAAVLDKSARFVPYVCAFLLVNLIIVSMLISGVRVNSPYYIWTILVWTIFYIAASHRGRRSATLKTVKAS